MKPANRVQERLTFPARADRILERIRIITRELEVIQAEIYARLGEESHASNSRLLGDAAPAQVLGQFRAALDHARQMLWLCTETAGTADPAHDRQPGHASALLQALSPTGSQISSGHPAPHRGLGSEAPVSFFDRLDRVIDNYVEDGGNLVGPDSKRRPKT